MKLRVLEGEKFSCQSCTQCCRDWHVELLAGEVRDIPALAWPEGDELRGKGAAVLAKFGGKAVLAHKANGACVFLNEENGRCRIHEKFGEAAKPLGCRLFPFYLTPTFRNEVSATARYDCPSVRKNIGAPHVEQRGSLEKYAKELGLAGREGFDENTRCYLEREQIEAVADFAGTLLGAFERDDERALFLAFLGEWLAGLKVGELDRATLGNIFPALKEQVEATMAVPISRPGWLHRLAFRTLLAIFLRRDEDILKGRAGRFRRAFATAAVALGGGSLRGLAVLHRPGPLRRAALFKERIGHADPATFAQHWRLVRAKLGSLQFMGPGNGGRDFLGGLRSLAMLYPLVLAVAKHSAANRGAKVIDADDVEVAVAAIDHSYGKLKVLNQRLARFLETVLLEHATLVRLVRTV